MILLKTPRVGPELRLLHPTLWGIFRWVAETGWTKATGEQHCVVTCVWRSQEETAEIYRDAGLTPPVASVHGSVKSPMDPLSGVRGLDLSARSADRGLREGTAYGAWPFIPRPRLDALAELINTRWRYHAAERFNVCLVHGVAGLHVHLQVAQGAETVERGRFT